MTVGSPLKLIDLTYNELRFTEPAKRFTRNIVLT